jgi:hypothetical protein
MSESSNDPCAAPSPRAAAANPIGLVFTGDHAEELGVTRRGLNQMIARGDLPPPFQVGRRSYWRRKDLEAHYATKARAARKAAPPLRLPAVRRPAPPPRAAGATKPAATPQPPPLAAVDATATQAIAGTPAALPEPEAGPPPDNGDAASNPRAQRPFLGKREELVFDFLEALKPGRVRTGKEILNHLLANDEPCDQATLTTRVLPKLKQWGLRKNPEGNGYYLEQRQRPAKERPSGSKIPGVSIYKPAGRAAPHHRWLMSWVEDGRRHVKSASTSLELTRRTAMQISDRLERRRLGLTTDREAKWAAPDQRRISAHIDDFRDSITEGAIGQAGPGGPQPAHEAGRVVRVRAAE